MLYAFALFAVNIRERVSIEDLTFDRRAILQNNRNGFDSIVITGLMWFDFGT